MNNSKRKINRKLFSFKSYIFYFIMVAFAMTCCFKLFLSHLNNYDIYNSIRESTILTFINVIFICLVFTVLDGIYHKIKVERPLKRILEATDKLTNGDFSVKIKPFHEFDSINELDIIIENFNKMAEELLSIEILKIDFISNVSHELKTPLAIIQNYANVLQSTSITEEQRIEYASAIAQASFRLSNLITNILKLNKLENQQIFPETKEFDLGNQLCECILNFEDIWESKNLDIDTNIDESVKVKSDDELLALVWNNIFSNAVKFTDTNGKITVSLKKENNFAVVKISDTGCGMSPEIGKQIFEKFYQGDKSHATQGNGLGLALVKKVIDIIKGEIFVESEVGKGTTFTVKLRRVLNEKN